MNKLYLIFILHLFLFQAVKSQQAATPIDISLFLSGNFAELRTNHFHSGIDFKIQGKIGEPIKTIEEGYIARIYVSPSGYGRALYLNHPNGTTSVYAHLDHFASEIETFVRDSQYIKESFSVNLMLSEKQFPVKKGEIIGYGGNTGSSGGPHLHFEIRDTHTEEVMDPLPLYMTEIQDNRPPQIQSLIVYPQQGKGIVNGSTDKQILSIKKDKSGNQVLSLALEAWGEIGLGIKAYDYMNGTTNSYGVKKIVLEVDSDEVFRMEINRFAFSETRYLNSITDWEEWTYRKSFFMKSFIEPGNLLRACQAKNNGIIRIDQEKKYRLTYKVSDLYGNTTAFKFTITGKKQEIPEFQSRGTYLAYNKENQIIVDEVELNIPKGNLYTDLYFSYSRKKNYTSFSPLFHLHHRTPLHEHCPLRITIANNTFPDKSKYGIISVLGKRSDWVGGNYEDGVMVAGIRELGDFSIEVDTIPPSITPLSPKNWSAQKRILFTIKDNLSGISKWYATLGDQFVLFELDAKKSLLFCDFDPERMKPEKQKLVLRVEDGTGNQQVYENNISW